MIIDKFMNVNKKKEKGGFLIVVTSIRITPLMLME